MEVQILQTRHRKNMRTATVKKMQSSLSRNSPDKAAKRMRMVLNASWRN